MQVLEQLPVKGRAPKTGYDRAQFGGGWAEVDGCDVRDRVLARQLTSVRFAAAGDGRRCTVLKGDLADPYTRRAIHSDAASWLPVNRAFPCSYVASQVRVKGAYALWITAPEKAAMQRVMKGCAPGVGVQASR